MRYRCLARKPLKNRISLAVNPLRTNRTAVQAAAQITIRAETLKNPEACHTRTNEDTTIDAKILFKTKPKSTSSVMCRTE
jgi:hypothetical protein